MKVIICGGRDYRNSAHMFAWLDEYNRRHPITCVIEGGAHGADRIAWMWANKNKIPVMEFPALFNKYGLKAGPIRNQIMLDQNPDIVIYFPGGDGTKDMISRAKNKGLKVLDGTKEIFE